MNKKTFLKISAMLLFAPLALHAQYPDVPKDLKAAADNMILTETNYADSVMLANTVILKAEKCNGKPYIPWAARPTDLPQAKIPSFPGAEGGGEYSFGGRGGKVITVTSLADRGPGTLREACEGTVGARIVVFNVAGLIHLKSPIIVEAPYLTIAGQTAPGDGVCVAGESFWVNTHDVVVRHMRFRRGETKVERRDDAFGGNPVGNIMIDHCSCEWGLDENISFYRHMFNPGPGMKEEKLPTVNVTIQNTISAQALDTYNHAFGSTLGGENCSFMRNLWANNAGRNPSIGWNGVFNFVNNVIYNWHNRSVDGGDYTALYNIINNYYKPGPLTPKNEPVGNRILKPESGRSKLGYLVFGRVYCNGNIMEGNDAVTKDNWNGGVQVEEMENAGQYTDSMRWNEPFPKPEFPIMQAKDAYNFVMDNVGANIPKRDIVDEHIITQVKTGKAYYKEGLDSVNFFQFKHRRLGKDSYKYGIITDIRQVGGYPEYKGKPYVDSDKDGMPDVWEKANGLNPKDPSDAIKDCTGDGYTNIEKYINGISTKQKTDWTKPENNHDTLAEKGKLM
ncbi:MAG: polysaccharide lyase [Paludibacter sp.]